jgi:hypothetical protein
MRKHAAPIPDEAAADIQLECITHKPPVFQVGIHLFNPLSKKVDPAAPNVVAAGCELTNLLEESAPISSNKNVQHCVLQSRFFVSVVKINSLK